MLIPYDDQLARSLEAKHGVSTILSRLLVQRKITEDGQIEKFLRPSLAHLPDPSLLLGMEKAVARIVAAIRDREKIVVYGDYDVDGTTSTALLTEFFRDVGANVDYYIPHRLREGYSLNVEALKKIREGGARVVITVDNGISAVAEAQAARELGLDLIITDHHEVPPQLPDAFAILNPKQVGDEFPGKELAGVGVAFYLLIALRKALREAGLLSDQEPNLRQALDLVAVGTVADMAPLVGVNRILVNEGLKVLSRTSRPGFRALKEVAGVEDEVTADQVGFRLGPRINAVGRLDDASFGVKLLLSRNDAEAMELSRRLDRANAERQDLEDDIVVQALAKVEVDGLALRRRSLVLFHEDWHPGVVGIVASRLVEKYYLPSIVLSRDKAGLKGSARSIRNLNLVETLRDCAGLLTKFGGHFYAAGLSLEENNLGAFSEAFDVAVRSRLKDEDFQPSLKLDVESELDLIHPEMLEEIRRLQPFGLGNPEPVLLLKGVTVRESRIVGENHLKMRVGEGSVQFGAIGFRLADKLPPLSSQVDLACVPGWNEWNGSKNIQLRVIDLSPTGSNASRK
ncbi:MAG: single-stranded-DNA-specific exonuclease RecJ [Deltaproteobacteria bacterium]|nr:single-stranded-DNA-specific exonuclease RecJ [Deltaproteobacteria bacterium]